MTGTVITPEAWLSHEDKMVLGYCGESKYMGYGMSHFSGALMDAFKHADTGNFDRLAKGFPDLARAWSRYRLGVTTARSNIVVHIGDPGDEQPGVA